MHGKTPRGILSVNSKDYNVTGNIIIHSDLHMYMLEYNKGGTGESLNLQHIYVITSFTKDKKHHSVSSAEIYER